MKIHSFKLIEHGRTGVEVGAEEVVGTREGFGILDSVNRKRKLSLNLATMNEIEKLKYFFMVISGYWMEPFNKYFDFESYQPKPVNPDSEMPFGQMALRTLWNRIRIIGAQEKAVGFLLKGTYQISENKVMAINTPVITEDDDYSVFNDALDMLEKIFEMIAGYFAHAENSLEEKKKSMISDHSGEEIDESEITRQVIAELENKGAIIMMDSQGSIEEGVEDSDKDNADQNIDIVSHNSIESPENRITESREDDQSKSTLEEKQEKDEDDQVMQDNGSWAEDQEGSPPEYDDNQPNLPADKEPEKIVKKPSDSTLAGNNNWPDMD